MFAKIQIINILEKLPVMKSLILCELLGKTMLLCSWEKLESFPGRKIFA
jgi:hypothetical protein